MDILPPSFPIVREGFRTGQSVGRKKDGGRLESRCGPVVRIFSLDLHVDGLGSTREGPDSSYFPNVSLYVHTQTHICVHMDIYF